MADFVLDRGNGFQLELWGHRGKLVLPERAYYGIAELSDDVLPEASVTEQAQHGQERRPRYFQQCEQCVSQDMLQSRSPERAVELTERRQNAGCNQRPLVAIAACEEVEGQRMTGIASIEKDHVICASGRDARQHGLDKVAVRVDETGAAVSSNVGRDEMVQERALAHAGLAENGHMPTAVVSANAEAFSLAAKCRHPEGGQVGMWFPGESHRWLELPALYSCHGWSTHRDSRQVEDGRGQSGGDPVCTEYRHGAE